MVSSVQATPDSEPACVVPPTPSISDAVGNSLRTLRLPEYGVAASSVSLISSMLLVTLLPLTLTGLAALAGQYEQGPLNQALPQVSNGALAKVRQLSLRILPQLCGQRASVHWVARYIA